MNAKVETKMADNSRKTIQNYIVANVEGSFNPVRTSPWVAGHERPPKYDFRQHWLVSAERNSLLCLRNTIAFAGDEVRVC